MPSSRYSCPYFDASGIRLRTLITEAAGFRDNPGKSGTVEKSVNGPVWLEQ